jgi:hypothetical protein
MRTNRAHTPCPAQQYPLLFSVPTRSAPFTGASAWDQNPGLCRLGVRIDRTSSPVIPVNGEPKSATHHIVHVPPLRSRRSHADAVDTKVCRNSVQMDKGTQRRPEDSTLHVDISTRSHSQSTASRLLQLQGQHLP